MKKMLATCCALVLAGSTAFAFVGCNKGGGKQEEAGTVMNVSLNPEVEFVLDADGTVVSVNALNEEGNLIVSAAAFTGKSAEEAAELFVQVSDETGFLFEGDIAVGENKISVSFSGDEEKAAELYNDVKGKVEAYLQSADIKGSIEQAKAITEEQLRALVAECEPYLDQAKVQALSYMELVETIAESRKETAEMYSQEVKNAYYEAKAFALEQAELETIKQHLGVIEKAAYDMAFAGYSTAVELIESTRMSMLVNENSPYQVALRAFQAAKADYLKFRDELAADYNEKTGESLPEELAARLAEYQAAVETTETALVNAGKSANETLDGLKASVEQAYQALTTAIGNFSAKLNEHAAEISESVTTAETAFFADFESAYAGAIAAAKTGWADMKNSLQQDDNA